ncbi:hypothetical protein [Cohaesibacter gelatinilyticus]|uniref:Uncharacterized protein n=1 Tax=Cohaesibacter gelatinilyticus TaxID=372072 RepID=A0A285PLG5_9HYPH|nr:hypothetical protein [Cohaesibacter gelatinilyticus]SNZ20946.1 hypothetical protein SAMN06265368_4060 [Cohaesibacter gelatinilyticus]
MLKSALLTPRSIAWLASAPFGPQIAFAPEDGTGTGDGEGAGDENNQNENSQDNSPYRPEGLAEDYHGENDQETIDRLVASLNASNPQLPEDVSGYDFKPDDELKSYFGDTDDPLLNSAKAAALECGITPDKFQDFINKTFKGPVAEGLLTPAYDPKKEFDTLAGYLKTDPQGAEKAANDALAIAENMGKNLGLPESAQGFMSGMSEIADGIMIIRAIENMAQEKGVALGETADGSTAFFSKEELARMGDDPRLKPSSSKYDASVEKKYNASYQHHYPG